jgi:antitoxin HicB
MPTTVTVTTPDRYAAVSEILKLPYARVIFPESDGTFRGEIMEFPGCIATGETAARALEQLEGVAKDWLLAALERGQNIPQPVETNNEFSGRLVLRIPKSLHKKATWIAECEGVSLNQFITTSLSESVGERSRSGIGMFVSAPTYISPMTINCSQTVLVGSTASLDTFNSGSSISGAYFVATGPNVGNTMMSSSTIVEGTGTRLSSIGTSFNTVNGNVDTLALTAFNSVSTR